MKFLHPEYLWFLLVLIPCIAWYIYTCRRRYASMSISTTSSLQKLGRPFKQYLIYALFGVRMLAIAAIIVVIARPQQEIRWSTSNIEGTDIVLALDISSSMLARDLQPDRLEAAKEVASKFVSGRENDNIGLVVFAGESFSAVPMTTDHGVLLNYINDLECGMLEDNTAIGDGIASAINRIKEGKAKSRSIILLTDGSNNAGIVNPLDAADIAQQNGIKIYTIGIGSYGTADYPQQDQFGRISYIKLPVVIDETTLQKIASTTNGKYFRANNSNVLAEVFQEIDRLEKTEMDVKKFAVPEESFLPWALLAIGLLAFELLCRTLVIRNIP